jgi:hypothetical protein
MCVSKRCGGIRFTWICRGALRTDGRLGRCRSDSDGREAERLLSLSHDGQCLMGLGVSDGRAIATGKCGAMPATGGL